MNCCGDIIACLQFVNKLTGSAAPALALTSTQSSLYASAPMQRWLKWFFRHKQLSLALVLCGATVARDVTLNRAYPAAGLRGTYFASTDWSGPPVFTAFDTDFS